MIKKTSLEKNLAICSMPTVQGLWTLLAHKRSPLDEVHSSQSQRLSQTRVMTLQTFSQTQSTQLRTQTSVAQAILTKGK
jgi:hypothetical protein